MNHSVDAVWRWIQIQRGAYFFSLDDYDSLDEAVKATKKGNGKRVPKYSSALLSEVAKEMHGKEWVEELDI